MYMSKNAERSIYTAKAFIRVGNKLAASRTLTSTHRASLRKSDQKAIEAYIQELELTDTVCIVNNCLVTRG